MAACLVKNGGGFDGWCWARKALDRIIGGDQEDIALYFKALLRFAGVEASFTVFVAEGAISELHIRPQGHMEIRPVPERISPPKTHSRVFGGPASRGRKDAGSTGCGFIAW